MMSLCLRNRRVFPAFVCPAVVHISLETEKEWKIICMPCPITLSLQGTKTPNACTWHIQFQSSGKSTWLNLGINILRFDPGISLNLNTQRFGNCIARLPLHAYTAMPSSAPRCEQRQQEVRKGPHHIDWGLSEQSLAPLR